MNWRFEITDQGWDRLAPPRQGGRRRDHRQILGGVLSQVRSGVPWRDLAERYGPRQTVSKRFAWLCAGPDQPCGGP